MQMLTEDYIVGLVDGEGSFTAFVQDQNKPKISKRRVKVEPRFYLKLNERDKDILYSLKRYFNCGNVYFQKDRRKNHQQCYRFEVTKRNDLSEIIIPFFEKHQLLMPTKRNDFKIFCQIMKLVSKGEHLNKDGLCRISKLKQKMH